MKTGTIFKPIAFFNSDTSSVADIFCADINVSTLYITHNITSNEEWCRHSRDRMVVGFTTSFSPLKFYVRIPLMVRCSRYSIM